MSNCEVKIKLLRSAVKAMLMAQTYAMLFWTTFIFYTAALDMRGFLGSVLQLALGYAASTFVTTASLFFVLRKGRQREPRGGWP